MIFEDTFSWVSWNIQHRHLFLPTICFDLGVWCRTNPGGANSEINALVSLGIIQVSVTIMREILWSEKYAFRVGPLFLRDRMLEQASLVDSGSFDFCELGPGLVLMSPAKSNKIRKAVFCLLQSFGGRWWQEKQRFKNQERRQAFTNFKIYQSRWLLCEQISKGAYNP